MPNLGLSNQEAVIVAGYLESLTEKTNGKDKREKVAAQTVRKDLIAEGEKLFSDLGCGTCHSEIKGDEKPIAPDLTYVGDKLKRSWALGYLKEPTSIRPWLKARMPDFHFTEREALAITGYLMARRDKNASQLPAQLLAAKKPSEVMVKAGRRLASKNYFDCLSCHPFGDKKPIAPDLTYVGDKLKRNWALGYLKKPTSIRPWLKARQPYFSFISFFPCRIIAASGQGVFCLLVESLSPRAVKYSVKAPTSTLESRKSGILDRLSGT